jgi:hypothetical protein
MVRRTKRYALSALQLSIALYVLACTASIAQRFMWDRQERAARRELATALLRSLKQKERA